MEDRLQSEEPVAPSLADVDITDELRHRPSRPPDYAAENRALTALAEGLTADPHGVVQQVPELVLQLCRADSAGVSVLEDEGGEEVFRWHAAAGALAHNLHGTMPRPAGLRDTAVMRNRVLLFSEAGRVFPALRGAEPPIYENLLVSWEVNGRVTGTVWAIKHSPEGRFDAEDTRLLASLARFAGAAYGAIERVRHAAEERVAALNLMEDAIDARRETERAERAVAEELRYTKILQGLSARLVTEENIQTIYDEILAAAIEIMRADAGTVQRLDAESEELVFLAVRNITRGMIEFFWRIDAGSATPCGLALKTGERSYVEFDLTGIKDEDGSMRRHVEEGLLSAQSTPFVSRSGRPIGMVTTHWRRSGHRPSERELRFLDLLARQAADLIEQHQSEEALRASEEKYRTLFDSIDEGFCLFELIYDENGQAVDYRFLEVNEVFERQTGLVNAVGRLGGEIAPNTENYWLALYAEVARTGEPQRIENYNQATGRWYSAYASRVGAPGSRQVCSVFDDITERKRREWQQAFLLKLNDALRSQSDAVQIQAAVSESVLDYFGADRCYYCEIEENKAIIRRDASRGDLPSVAGVYSLEDFPLFKALMNDGVPFVVQDSNTTDAMDAELKQLCLQMQIISFINVPVIKGNQHVGCLCITQSTPRTWADFETKLAEEIAERTWAAVERARAEEALRASEERLRALIENLPGSAAFIVDRNLRYLLAKGEALADAGLRTEDLIGRTIFEALPPELSEAYEPMYRKALAGETFAHEHAAHGRSFISQGVPLCDAHGEIYAVLVVSYDITARVQAEEAVRTSEERLRQLNEALEEGVRERTLELAEANISLQSEVRERRAAEERVKGLLRQLVTVQEEERRRIARELHDTLGQQLAALHISIEIIKSQADGHAALHEHVDRMRDIFDRLNSDVDFLAWELRPAALDMLGLDAGLEYFVREWARQFGVEAEYRGCGPDAPRLPPEVETNLYRILQEALQNVHKHAGATHVSVLLEQRDGRAVLIVEDDGRGYDPEEEEAADGNKGMGVTNMRERAALVGGTLEIESAPGAGTTVFVRVPLDGLGGECEGS